MIEEQDAIGVQLRSAREAAGLSLDDVVFQTQLPRKVIAALENEDFSVFTSPLYAKSFLSQYSAFLGVDADPWIDAIEPGDFVPAEGIGTILDGPAVSAPAVAADPAGRRGGWLAVLGLLAVSVGLVVAAIKGYDAFEKRFGGEPPSSTRPAEAMADGPAPQPVNPAPATTQVLSQNSTGPKKTAVQAEEEVLAQPPPRAIIVR